MKPRVTTPKMPPRRLHRDRTSRDRGFAKIAFWLAIGGLGYALTCSLHGEAERRLDSPTSIERSG